MGKIKSLWDEKQEADVKEKAEKGSLTALQMLQKREREERLNAAREDMLGKAMFEKPGVVKDIVQEMAVMPNDRTLPAKIDELDISEIETFIQRGEFNTLPEHMAVYLKWMEIAHDWYYKFKSRTWVIRYLVSNCKNENEDSISYYFAEKIFNDMMVFFYPDKNFRRNSWLRYLAERIEMGAALAWEDNDFETFGKNMERAAKVLQMITVEKGETDPRLLDRRPRFFVTDAKALGIPAVDRYALARQIDEMDISEKEKLEAKRDLGTEERDMLDP
jgi:hypothetical protein